MNICPVVETIKEIRGSGLWTDDDDRNIIKIGGSEATTDFICDNLTFYIMTKKMEFARFKLSKPDYATCKSKYHKEFKKLSTSTYADVYAILVDTVLCKNYMYTQFTNLVDLVSDMESLIISRVERSGRSGHNINITLPDIILLPHVDKLILYRTDILAETMNKFISYVNKININSIINENVRADIPAVEKFDKKLDMTTKISSNETEPNDAEGYIMEMEKILSHEMIVANYVGEIEKYHCGVINHLNKVYDICKKLIAALV